jgi:hypothetical protein
MHIGGLIRWIDQLFIQPYTLYMQIVGSSTPACQPLERLDKYALGLIEVS